MTEPKHQLTTGSVARNKRAWHDYEIVEKVEAGLQLVGTEVKSLRNKQCDLEGAFARIQDGECWLMGCKIAPYAQGGYVNHDPLRKRKLLLHRSQIKKIRTKLEQRGFTLIPLSVYFNSRGLAKVELGLAHGKRKYDKRRQLHEQQVRRDMNRGFNRK
ncbi:MAG: SsrA-binding protein SmpB [Planctomycetes bacterium]|jgi:SsrA-binding protein|nr:SsrA-binding protein SmpB [Planctomycetota bacterium]